MNIAFIMKAIRSSARTVGKCILGVKTKCFLYWIQGKWLPFVNFAGTHVLECKEYTVKVDTSTHCFCWMYHQTWVLCTLMDLDLVFFTTRSVQDLFTAQIWQTLTQYWACNVILYHIALLGVGGLISVQLVVVKNQLWEQKMHWNKFPGTLIFKTFCGKLPAPQCRRGCSFPATYPKRPPSSQQDSAPPILQFFNSKTLMRPTLLTLHKIWREHFISIWLTNTHFLEGITYQFPSECWCWHILLFLWDSCFLCMVCVGESVGPCISWPGQSQWCTRDCPSYPVPSRSYLAWCPDV